MAVKFERCPENPIIWPGKWPWRMSHAYNPGVLYEGGRFFLFERATVPFADLMEYLLFPDRINDRSRDRGSRLLLKWSISIMGAY